MHPIIGLLFTSGAVPGAKTLEVSLGPWAAAGICDFDDVKEFD